jgi:hypothetical protein
MKTLALREAKGLDRVALSTGAQILNDIASNLPETNVKVIVRDRPTASEQRLFDKLKRKGLKGKREVIASSPEKNKMDKKKSSHAGKKEVVPKENYKTAKWPVKRDISQHSSFDVDTRWRALPRYLSTTYPPRSP